MAKKQKQRNPVAAIVFLGYCALMIYLLFIRGRAVTDGLPYWEQIQNNCNFVPWRTVGNYWDVLTRAEYYIEKWGTYSAYHVQAKIAWINILGNIAMFVPFGAFLPAMWQSLQKAWKAIPMGFLSVVAIELIQLFTLRGRLDVDDVLLNMIGIFVGYVFWWFIRLVVGKRK